MCVCVCVCVCPGGGPLGAAGRLCVRADMAVLSLRVMTEISVAPLVPAVCTSPGFERQSKTSGEMGSSGEGVCVCVCVCACVCVCVCV